MSKTLQTLVICTSLLGCYEPDRKTIDEPDHAHQTQSILHIHQNALKKIINNFRRYLQQDKVLCLDSHHSFELENNIYTVRVNFTPKDINGVRLTFAVNTKLPNFDGCFPETTAATYIVNTKEGDTKAYLQTACEDSIETDLIGMQIPILNFDIYNQEGSYGVCVESRR